MHEALAETRKASTLQRRLSAISQMHQVAGRETPTRHAAVKTVWQGIRRANGTAQERKAPFLTADVRLMVAALPDGLRGMRDRALLLVGFVGAFRRSELVAINCNDVDRVPRASSSRFSGASRDQEGQGRRAAIP